MKLETLFGVINVCFIFLVLAFIIYFILYSNKSIKHLYREIVYELKYNVLGFKAILEDYIVRENYKNEYQATTKRVVVITGGARGIGAEVVKKLLKQDLHVVIGCRNVAAGQQLIKKIRELGIESGKSEVLKLDVASLNSIKTFSDIVNEKYSNIHILINNAGKMFGPYITSDDGYESQFSTNYLGHFYLTHLLLPKLISAGQPNRNSRIVNVSSCAYLLGHINFEDINLKNEYIASAAYAQSKLGQILFTLHLNNLMKKQNLPVSVYSVHPGIVNTDLFNETLLKKILGSWVLNIIFKTPQQGATSIMYASLSSQLESSSGAYISNCQIQAVSKTANDEDLQKKLFKFTNNLLSIKEFGKN